MIHSGHPFAHIHGTALNAVTHHDCPYRDASGRPAQSFPSRIRTLVTMVVAVALASCGTVQKSLIPVLVDKGSIEDLAVPGQDTTVVVLLDPAACLSCNAALFGILEARRLIPHNVRLVLRRPASAAERIQLALQHQAVDGVLRHDLAGADSITVLLLYNRRQVYQGPLSQSKQLVGRIIGRAVDKQRHSIPTTGGSS